VLDEAFSPGGRSLATAAADGTAIVWDLHQGRATERLKGHRDGVPNLAFSPDGRTLYTESFDSTAIIWDVAGDRRLGRPFTTGLAPVPYNVFPPAFAVSPDGRTLAVARLDGLVDLIDAATLRRKRSFEALHRTPATAIEYTPDGRGLAVAGGRGLIGLWDVDSGRRVGALLHAPPHGGPCAEPSTVRLPECNESTIQAVAVSRDGLLAAVGIGGDLRIWDLASRELVEPRLQVPPLVVGLAFSPDGSRLAAPFGLFHAGADGVEVLDPAAASASPCC
jgi:WD40 repeat protein